MQRNRIRKELSRFLYTFVFYYIIVLFFSIFMTKMGCKAKMFVPDGSGSSWQEIADFLPIMAIFSIIVTAILMVILRYLDSI